MEYEPLQTQLIPVLCQVRFELGILRLQLSRHVRDQGPRNHPTHQGKCGSNQKNCLLALHRRSKGVLNRSKHLRPDRGPSLPHGGRKSKKMSPQGGGERFRGAEKRRDTRAHLPESLENSIHDNEQGEDPLNRSERAAQDEPPESPEQEAECHRLFPANAIHQKTSKQTAGKIKTVDDGLQNELSVSPVPAIHHENTHPISIVFNRSVSGIQLLNDRGGEQPEWVRHKIITEPGHCYRRQL